MADTNIAWRVSTFENNSGVKLTIPMKGSLSTYTDNILYNGNINFRYYLKRATFSGNNTSGKVTAGGWEGFSAISSVTGYLSKSGNNMGYYKDISQLPVVSTNYNDSQLGTCNFGCLTLNTNGKLLPASGTITIQFNRQITNTLTTTSGSFVFGSAGYVWNNSMMFRANGSNIGFNSSYIYYNDDSEYSSSYKYQILPSNTMYLRVATSANYYVSEGQSFYINRWKTVTSSKTPGGTRYTRRAYIKLTIDNSGTTIASANSDSTTSSNPPSVAYPNMGLYANTSQSGGTNGRKVIYVRKL